MAELATIARPYAEALFKTASSDGSAILAWLDEMAVVTADARLLAFAASPKASAQQVYDLVCGVLKTPLDARAQNFLRAVIDNRRLSALPEVAAQFRALTNAKSGSSDALVYSAFPIGEQQLAEVSSVLEKRFARKLNVSVALQPELIGGIRVVVGDEVLDTSVKARLEQMKVALTA